MKYILLHFAEGFDAYQEIENGVCINYKDADGNVLFTIPPIGDGGELVNEFPDSLPWMIPDA